MNLIHANQSHGLRGTHSKSEALLTMHGRDTIVAKLDDVSGCIFYENVPIETFSII